MAGALEFDGATSERRGQAEVSHPTRRSASADRCER
jgi:hypothetical protein